LKELLAYTSDEFYTILASIQKDYEEHSSSYYFMREILYAGLQEPNKDLRFWDDMQEVFYQLDGQDIINFFQKYLTKESKLIENECKKLSVYVYKAGDTLPDCNG
jgi:hypothetical protein